MKFSLFILNIATLTIVNAFFFTDNTLDHIYMKNGSFDFIFSLRQIFLSFLICMAVNILMKIFIKSEHAIIDIKQGNEDFENAKKNLQIKYCVYFFLGLIIILFGWYYISCFCAALPNTQMKLLLCSFLTSLIGFFYAFISSFVPVILRFCALNAANKDKNCLYEFSKIIGYI